MTSGSLWNYYRDKIFHVDDNISDGKSFKCKIKIEGKTTERPERPMRPPQNPDGTQSLQPLQPPVSALNAALTISLK